MAKQKYYAIKVGKGVTNVIVETWKECEELVSGYHAIYKSFKSREEAEVYLNPNKVIDKDKNNNKEIKINKLKKKKREKDKVEVSIMISSKLYSKFLKRCENMKMNESKTLTSLMNEILEEWTDDI